MDFCSYSHKGKEIPLNQFKKEHYLLMPFAIILIVGLVVFNSGVIDKAKESQKKAVTEIVSQDNSKKNLLLKKSNQFLNNPNLLKKRLKLK